MDGLEKILDKIIADAKQKDQEIIMQAEREAEEIRKNAELDAGAYREKRMEYARAEAQKAHDRAVSGAKMEAKKRLLAAKQELLDECFRRAREAVLAMPSGTYEDLLIEQILSAAEDGTEQLILSGRDKERLSLLRFLARVNARLADSGEKAAITISEDTVDAAAGFLLKKGDVVINCTLDALLAAKREELEVELAVILF